MDANVEKLLNEVYCRLNAKCTELTEVLRREGFRAEWGFYSGHYHKNREGAYEMDHYPIPVLSVEGLCDIEISLDKIGVTAKKTRADALAASYDAFREIPFEAYGVEDYLSDYRPQGASVGEMKENIRRSGEAEIGFAFSFPFDTSGENFCAFTELLRREGFYY